MNAPEWLQPGLYGAGLGAIAVAIFGFTWGGWQTAGAAQDMATDSSERAVVAALLPVCLERARSDVARAETFAILREEPGYRRRDVVMNAGWATAPGVEAPDRALAQACLDALDLEAS